MHLCKNLTASFVDSFAARQWHVQSSPDILAAGQAVMIKTKAFSISSTSPEHPSVQNHLSAVKVTMVTAEVALDRVI